MKFEVEAAINGFTVKVDEDDGVHVARTIEEVAEIVTNALNGDEPKPVKVKKTRGKNKKKAMAANADTLSGLNT